MRVIFRGGGHTPTFWTGATVPFLQAIQRSDKNITGYVGDDGHVQCDVDWCIAPKPRIRFFHYTVAQLF